MVVLARGADGAIYERHLEGGNWTAWASIGGVAASGPAAAAYGDSIHAFVLGTDLAVYENVLRAGQWSGWTSLGGKGSSAPAAISRRGTNYLDVAVRGTDNSMFLKTFQPGSGWSNWSPLGGGFTNGPALNSQDPTVLNVWGRGLDGQLFQRAWNGSAWSDWMPLGGYLTGAPSVDLADGEPRRRLRPRGRSRQLPEVLARRRGLDRLVRARPAPAGLDAGGRLGRAGPRGALRTLRRHAADQGMARHERLDGVDRLGARRAAARPRPLRPRPRRPATASPPCAPACAARRRAAASSSSSRSTSAPACRAPHIRRVVFYVRNGPRRVDRHKPYRARLRLKRKAGTKGRVFARVYYTRAGSKKVRRKTVSRPFVMCG